MASRFKGLYHKSFKCFADVFDEKEEDEEMEIGYPTDVRHVSHIGWDSSSSSAPSWIHEFKTSKDNLEPNSSWPFQDITSAMEAFGEVESSKELIIKDSTKQNLKKKLSLKASLMCNPWSPRFSRSSKVLA